MTALTLKQIFDDKIILENCVATCMVNGKLTRIKQILSQYNYVKKSHLRYFRILVNTFDKLNQKAVIREILNRFKN
jgi:F0F1-type ATP synthase delta subunit